MLNTGIAQAPWQSILGLAILGLSAVIAGWYDGRYRRIPNWLCAATALAGLAFGLWSVGFPVIISNALHLFAALLGGMILFRVGAFGGGDAKYYAAIAAWFGLGKAILLLLCVALSGLVLLIIWFSYRRLAGYQIRKRAGTGLDGLPYGIAIGSGAIITMMSTFSLV
ncbi:MAG: prepilin peptidase [Novosphingobium sp.]